jgi:hypothetical protein
VARAAIEELRIECHKASPQGVGQIQVLEATTEADAVAGGTRRDQANSGWSTLNTIHVANSRVPN